jgi:hypothetical protein
MMNAGLDGSALPLRAIIADIIALADFVDINVMAMALNAFG